MLLLMHRVVWLQLFLEVLPEQQTLWYGSLQEHRLHYGELKERVRFVYIV